MLTRVCVAVSLGCLLLAGCGRTPDVGRKASSKPAGMSAVTLHVPTMTERLKLT
jgi:hypothetical protein